MAATKQKKVFVSERAVMARVNRKIAPHEAIRKCRGTKWIWDVANWPYYHRDYKGQIHPIELEEFARKLGVIQEWEALSDD